MILSRLLRFTRREDGAALAYVLVALPVLIGVLGFTFDLSRSVALHSELNDLADAAALAGAVELNRQPDARARARAAAIGLLDNTPRLAGDAAPAVDILEPEFYPSLEAADARSPVADSDENARFIRVQTQRRATTVTFIRAIFNDADDIESAAFAVAGQTITVCDLNPMFMCNPFGDLDALRTMLFADTRRPSVLLKAQSGSNWLPGNFGFLQTPDGSMNPHVVGEHFANNNPALCYSETGVDTRPGSVVPVNNYINVRFDIYGSQTNSMRTDASYGPAPNIIKGQVKTGSGGGCKYNETTSTDYMKLPRDTCFGSTGETCSTTSARFGDGDWDLATYWQRNHGGTPPTELTEDGHPSRYDVYMYEIENLGSMTWGPEGTAMKAGFCSTRPISDPDRRMIYAAVVDCSEQTGGQQTLFPDTFAKIFLTEPAGTPPNADIWGEIVDITGGLGTMDNMVRPDIVLYR